MTLPEKRTKGQFLYEDREETLSAPDELFNRELFPPVVDIAFSSITTRFSKMEDIYNLYGFNFSKEEMTEAIKSGRLEKQCLNLEKTMDDIDGEEMVMEVRAAVHTC